MFTAISLIAGITIKKSANANTEKPEAPQAQAMPVEVTIIEKQPVQIWREFSARLRAVDYAEIRPQVSGTITEIKFEDGQMVKKGDVLLVIDPRPYEAALAQAKAALEAAKSKHSFAWKDYKRAKSLRGSPSISERYYEERLSDMTFTKAEIDAAKAEVEQAQINLDHAHIKAPFDGRVSRAEITLGNLVESGPNAPILTSIVSSDGIYAEFDVDEQTYLHNVRGGAKDISAENMIPIKLVLNSIGTSYDGYIHSFDNRINPATGTIRARALLPNNDGTLLPGMYASVKMGSLGDENQIIVPSKAIGTNQSRKYVFIVNDNNIVEQQEIRLGDTIDDKRIVLSGLNEGDQIITEGIIRIRPGMPVSPQITNNNIQPAAAMPAPTNDSDTTQTQEPLQEEL